MLRVILMVFAGGLACACGQSTGRPARAALKPAFVTDLVPNDSDDPAIWINKDNPEKSLILGTDKHETEGGLYTFSLTGEMDPQRKVFPLARPNNVDIAYDFVLGDSTIDVAVCTERAKGSIRVFSLPDLQAIDGGGLAVFEDDPANNMAMGVALYTRVSDGELFAIVSRKGSADPNRYLYQYRIASDGGEVTGELVRKFGRFSGTKEIEAVAVDNELGYVYYSDEQYGVRKYWADPEKGDDELGVFGTEGFADDREGISIYDAGDGSGYIIVSDQGANAFRVFPREGVSGNPHLHPLMAVVPVQAVSSDGSEVISRALGEHFPHGLFVAMSDNKTFEIYKWESIQDYLDNN